MIKITERKTKKLPGKTSLFVEFVYRKEIVEAVKLCNNAIYHKKEQYWEVPVTSLKTLIENLSTLDELSLSFIADQKEQNKKDVKFLTEFKTSPYKYQLEGIEYGLTHDKWLLLDAPGLGKTLQIIYLAQELKARGEIEHCLILCGLNTLKANWKKEIEKHSDLSCRILGERVNTKGKVVFDGVEKRLEELKNPIDEFFVITNIETLRNDDIVKALKKGPNKFDMIALDEAHVCKSPTSQQGHNLLKVDATYKIAMTGTLLLNSPIDLFVPLKWIGEDRSTFTNFKYYYCNFGGLFNNVLLGYKNLPVLKDQLSECSLRRTKDLLDLPDKTVINEYVDMSPQQQKFYENLISGDLSTVDKVHMSTANLLALVTRFRQATACPSLLTSENIPSAKIDRAAELAEQIINNDSKVVIFSTFKESIKFLKEKLNIYNPVIGTGDMDDEEVSKNIDKFQTDPNCKVFIGTWQKCGTGITLTAANYMIFLDTPWTFGVYEQAQDRIHRIGTKEKVFIYNLICAHTIDERVLDIVSSKEAMSDYVIDDKINNSSLNILRNYIENLI